MKISSFIQKLVSSNQDEMLFKMVADSYGLNFVLPLLEFNRCEVGEGSDLVLHQYIYLKMLEEQGLAVRIPTGFRVTSEDAVRLESDASKLLDLPPLFSGQYETRVTGQTSQSAFDVQMIPVLADGKKIHSYKLKGPCLRLSENETFLLSPAELCAFKALDDHQTCLAHEKTEHRNLLLVATLQSAQKLKMPIDLSHFNKLKVFQPEKVSVSAVQQADGGLLLTPSFGTGDSADEVSCRLGQLNGVEGVGSLRIGDQIVVLDSKRLEATQELLTNRTIPASQVRDFLKSPSAFLNAELVDFDPGFSLRVKGATRFRHAYFGETDESGIDWFGEKFASSEVCPVSKVKSYITDQSTLAEFRENFEKAASIGADEVEFEDKVFDISDKQAVKKVISDIEHSFIEDPSGAGDELEEREIPEEEDSNEGSQEPVIIDIELNDDDLFQPSSFLDKAISEVLSRETDLDWSNYARDPYPHQVIGTRWILGLSLAQEGLGGGMLADDMGLGKTFMALAAMDHLYKHYRDDKKDEKPCLVVAPLSVLENWKDEVAVTFSQSPFKDIILLQSDGDLPRFRFGGVETKNQCIDGEEAKIRYSLKVGQATADSLDMPKRLVITTYQTLRDYQFSLCTIDWGMVVFDEAQNIKNPNALQTRAAKGLKADFRLIATGTPVENSLADFWCLMDTACPGYLDSYQEFRQNYVTPILRAAGDELEDIRGLIGRQLRDRVGALMLRRVKEDNLKGLPKKSIFVGMEDETWRYLPALSSTMQNGQLESYDKVLADVAESEQNTALSSLQRLRAVSLHPRLVYGGRLDAPQKKNDLKNLMYESGKFHSLLTVIDEIKSKNEKCIIFAINKKLQTFLAIALSRWYNFPLISVVNGDAKAVAKRSSSPTRKKMIAEFEARDGFNIIIMSPVAAGVGLTVVGANNVIHFDRHWNPAKEAQATDRVYRIGQVLPVNVYIPLIHHPVHQSFDVSLHQLLSKKSLLKDAVVTPEQVVPVPGGFEQEAWSPEDLITTTALKKLSWQQFEALCAEVLQKEYESTSCWLTHNGGDFGADVVLVGDDSNILVQCKHTIGNHYDGYHAIQEVSSARTRYEAELNKQFDQLVFVTNAARLGGSLRKVAKQYSVEVIDGKRLSALLDKHSVSYSTVLNRLDKKRLSV